MVVVTVINIVIVWYLYANRERLFPSSASLFQTPRPRRTEAAGFYFAAIFDEAGSAAWVSALRTCAPLTRESDGLMMTSSLVEMPERISIFWPQIAAQHDVAQFDPSVRQDDADLRAFGAEQ